MFDVMSFVNASMVIVIIVLYIIGMFIKAVPGISDWLIPFILIAIGVTFGIILLGNAEGILQGILCAGVSVLFNQVIKQGIEGFTISSKKDDINKE